MDQATHNKIVSFIWGIADDVLRDLFRRGKYPDVILPMCVLRRMDAVLEPTKQAVLDTKKMLDEAHITEQRAALADAAGQAFYNTSRFTLRDLKSRASRQQLLRRLLTTVLVQQRSAPLRLLPWKVGPLNRSRKTSSAIPQMKETILLCVAWSTVRILSCAV